MRNNCFTFLRYLFTLCIFCNHLCVTMGEEVFLGHGLVFVCGFFAMSGFLNFNSYRQTPDPKTFALKRFKRIYPAYGMTVLLCLLTGASLSTLSAETFFAQAETWKYLFCNLLFLNYQQPTLPGVFEGSPMPFVNASLWTMKVEVLFYISVPVVHWMIGKFGKHKVLLTIILLSLAYNYGTAVAYRLTGNQLFNTLNHQLPGELSYFYIPVLMHYHFDWVRKHGKRLMWASAALFALALLNGGCSFFLPLCLPPLVITFAYECTWLLATARWKDFSYEFYLLRFPILQTIVATGLAASLGQTAIVALILTFVLAIPLHYLSKALSNRI